MSHNDNSYYPFGKRRVVGYTEYWSSYCPHGYVVEHERDTLPGYRCHDRWTECPVCRRGL